MTLNEAIRHCEDKSDCTKCGKEHEQLADWLKELRAIREFVEPLRSFDTKHLYLEELKKIVKQN